MTGCFLSAASFHPCQNSLSVVSQPLVLGAASAYRTEDQRTDLNHPSGRASLDIVPVAQVRVEHLSRAPGWIPGGRTVFFWIPLAVYRLFYELVRIGFARKCQLESRTPLVITTSYERPPSVRKTCC